MRLGVFISDYKGQEDILKRLWAEKLGIFFVGNGVYHSVIKENGKSSPLLKKEANFYVLSEDIQSRGFENKEVHEKVVVITYSDLVDLIMNEYEKLVWL